MVLIAIYLLGVFFAILDVAHRIYEEVDKQHSLPFCITYTIFSRDTWRFTLKSWYYFIQTWKD